MSAVLRPASQMHAVWKGLLVLSLVACCVQLVTCEEREKTTQKDYTGHHVIRVYAEHEKHYRLLRSLREETKDGMEFWRHPTVGERTVDIQLAPHRAPLIRDVLQLNGLTYSVVTDNLQSLIDAERQTRDGETGDPATFNHTIYHTYDELMQWLDHMAEVCGDACSVIEIGKSSEGRPLKVIKIAFGPDYTPTIWIDGGIHAREWIAPATALYIIEKLVTSARSDPVMGYLVGTYTWYIMPVSNPDGYEYTWTTDRLWRKTRSVNPTSECRGTDPNRNWDLKWGTEGTSSDPCAENFRGPSPFSEPETRAMSAFLTSLRGRLSVYLSLHSYGQYWLTPWGFTYRVPSDYSDMVNLGAQAVKAMKRKHGSLYKVGSSARLLYLASGGSDDWVKGVLGVKYAYTVELTDTGRHGFILPPHHIESTGDEMVQAIRTLAVGVMRERRSATLDRRSSDYS